MSSILPYLFWGSAALFVAIIVYTTWRGDLDEQSSRYRLLVGVFLMLFMGTLGWCSPGDPFFLGDGYRDPAFR